MVFGLGKKLSGKERKEILKAVSEEKKKQARLKFEERKARAVARIRSPFSKKLKGVAVKAGRRAGKDIGKSLRGFAQKIGKPREEEKETLVILGGQPSRRIKGRVRVIQPADTGLGVGMDSGLGLSVDLLGNKPRKKRKRELEPIRFF